MSLKSRILIFAAAFVACQQVHAMELPIVNKTEMTIYRLYAWPSDLLPGTSNLLDFPLGDQKDVTVDIDNSFDICNFTFMIDINPPTIVKQKKSEKKPMIFDSRNICREKKPIVLLNDPDRFLN